LIFAFSFPSKKRLGFTVATGNRANRRAIHSQGYKKGQPLLPYILKKNKNLKSNH